MRYGSVCSGIEAASVAWEPLGWTPAWFSEIEKFPCAVLAHRFPEVPNLGDFTKIGKEHGAIDLLVGGTPCQDFSVAGLRAGLDGERGKLTVEFVRLAERLRPRWLVWENVPGVLSADGGRAFGIFLGALAKLGYGFAYRVLDAQFFGVPQRRRRVFVVGYRGGDWRPPAAVLFEPESLSGDSAPGREAREETAPTLSARTRGGGGLGSDAEIDGALMTMPPVNARMGETSVNDYATSGGLVTMPTLDGRAGTPGLHTFSVSGGLIARCVTMGEGFRLDSETCTFIAGLGDNSVRRLTPLECERLQGFPDGWTAVQYRGKRAADGPRYKAIGNSMAVPVMRWIGKRIQMCEEVMK